MMVRRTLKELGTLAVDEIGFCVGIFWTSVTGRRLPAGMISPHCRIAYILFTGYAPAYRFHALLTRQGIACLPRQRVRLVQVDHAGQQAVGVAVIAVLSPDRNLPTGWRRAPAYAAQRGYQRFFARHARPRDEAWPWWDHELGDAEATDRFASHELTPGTAYAERQADEVIEEELDRLEADYDAKLWWRKNSQQRTAYRPKLASVQELFAYARRHELTPEEIARRNREHQADQWVHEQRERDRLRQQELDADQAEIATALATPRRGRKHAEDQVWLMTTNAIVGRNGLKRLAREVAPRPARPSRSRQA